MESMRVIESLMQLENQINQEMSNRYRSSVITSAGLAADPSLSDAAAPSPGDFNNPGSARQGPPAGLFVRFPLFFYEMH